MKNPCSSARKLLLAAPALAAGAPTVHADIVYTDSADLTIGTGGSGAGIIFFELGHNGSTGSSSTESFVGYQFAAYFNSFNSESPQFKAINFPYGLIANTSDYATNFALGAPISASNFVSYTDIGFLNYFNFNDANWPAGGVPGYIGLRFDDGSGLKLGWARVSYNIDESLTLYDFAYQTDGSAIAAGAVPEPAETAMLAALFAGSSAAFAASRRRSASKQA